MKKAKNSGKQIGRPKAQKPDNWNDVITRWKNKQITAVAAMQELNMKPTTFYKLVKQGG